jgi:hypothetical protein
MPIYIHIPSKAARHLPHARWASSASSAPPTY